MVSDTFLPMGPQISIGHRLAASVVHPLSKRPAIFVISVATLQYVDSCTPTLGQLAHALSIGPCTLKPTEHSSAWLVLYGGSNSERGVAETPQWRLGPMFCRELCNRCGTRWQRAKNTRNPQGFFIWVSPQYHLHLGPVDPTLEARTRYSGLADLGVVLLVAEVVLAQLNTSGKKMLLRMLPMQQMPAMCVWLERLLTCTCCNAAGVASGVY